MDNKKQYRALMKSIRVSHQNFGSAWNEVRDAELRKRGIDPDTRHFKDYAPVWEANGVAYKAAQAQADRRNELLIALFDDVPFEEFAAGQTTAIDVVLDFLEIDVLAFRCGYAKEWCFRKLKSLPLNRQQVARLQQLTLAMCQFDGQRRELRELARLMIRLADKPSVENLRDLAQSSANKYTRQKAERVLKVILNSRHDLK